MPPEKKQVDQAERLQQAVLGRAPAVLGDAWHSQGELRDWAKRHARNYGRLLHKIEAAARSNSANRRSAQNRFLNSPSARICCVLLAIRGISSREEMEHLASVIRPWRDCGEAIALKRILKPDGTDRLVGRFGVRRRALNIMCRDILAVTLGISQDDYNAKGKGAHAATLALKLGISFNSPWVVTADVKDCFSSFGQDEIVRLLPLPESVIRNSILIPESAPIVSHGSYVSASDRDRLRQGIPQGLPASAIVVSNVLGRIIAPIGHDELVFHYADNVIAVLASEAQANATLTALKQSFGSSPAGGLTLHEVTVTHTDNGVHFLGYKTKTFADRDDWSSESYPSKRNRDRFEASLFEVLINTHPNKRDDVAIEMGLEFISCWRAWKPSELRIDGFLNSCLQIAAGTTATENEMIAAGHTGLSWEIAPGHSDGLPWEPLASQP